MLQRKFIKIFDRDTETRVVVATMSSDDDDDDEKTRAKSLIQPHVDEICAALGIANFEDDDDNEEDENGDSSFDVEGFIKEGGEKIDTRKRPRRCWRTWCPNFPSREAFPRVPNDVCSRKRKNEATRRNLRVCTRR